MLQQILPVIGKMLPPATWLALLKYSPLPTSAQKDISDSLQQAQSSSRSGTAKRDAELKLATDKAQADIANHKAISDAKIQAMQRGIGRQARSRDTQEAQHKALTESLTAPPVVGPDGRRSTIHGATPPR
jgi:5-deoxy-D-glucuronate isomerase